MIMRVEFYKRGEGRLCSWVATPPHRRAFEGSTMAADSGQPTPVGAALDVMFARWLALAEGAPLMLEWEVKPLSPAGPRPATPRTERRRHAHHRI